MGNDKVDEYKERDCIYNNDNNEILATLCSSRTSAALRDYRLCVEQKLYDEKHGTWRSFCNWQEDRCSLKDLPRLFARLPDEPAAGGARLLGEADDGGDEELDAVV